MKVLEIQDGKLTLEYQDGSTGSVESREHAKVIQKHIDSLTEQKYAIVDKIKIVSSVTAIEMLEVDLVKTEEEITKLEISKNAASRDAEAVDIHKIVAYVKYFMEHLHELLLDLCNPTLKAQYFSVLFDKAPTYEEIKSGTQKESVLPEVNELFRALNVRSSLMVNLSEADSQKYKTLADYTRTNISMN